MALASRGARRSERAAVCLLLLVASTPFVAAQAPVHEDYRRAGDDYTVLRVMAGRVLDESVRALNASLEDRHEDADARVEHAHALATGMHEVAARNATVATSVRVLAPLADAAVNLTGNATDLVDAWAEWRALNATTTVTREDALRARFLLARAAALVDAGFTNADAYDRVEYDTTWLRDALSRYREAVDAAVPPVVAADGNATMDIYLEAHPREVPLTHALTLRGVVLTRVPEGTLVNLTVDDAAWATTAPRTGGYFEATRVVPESTPLGAHEARATVRAGNGTLESAPAAFEVVRVPTRLTVALPATTFPVNATLSFTFTLTTDAGRALEDREIRFTVANATHGPVVTNDAGRAAVTVSARDLAPGTYHARAAFPGDARHAPHEATITFRVGSVAPTPSSTDAPSLVRDLGPWLLVALALVVHAGVLEATGPRAPRAFRALAFAGPLAWSALVLAVTRAPVLAGSVLAGAIGASALLTRRHAPRAERAPESAPAPASEAATAPVPAHVRDVVAAKTAVADVPAHDPRHALVALYRDFLTRLAATGVDVAPLTHREIARLMREQAYPEEPVRVVTRMIEGALYARSRVVEGDVPSFERALAHLGVGPS